MTSPTSNGAEALPQALRGQRSLAAIAFTDGVNFSARMAADEEHTLTLINRDLQMMAQRCQEFEGQVLKTTGDGLLMYFTSAVKAVECAIAIQRAIAQIAADQPPQDVLSHRIGIHLGDVFFSANDVMGNGVNIAARLQTKADPGGICLSQTVYDVVKSQLELNTTYLGPQELKNIKEPIPAYQILVAPPLDAPLLTPSKVGRKPSEAELTSPYKGLKKFELEDKDSFFGRDQLVASLVNDLEQSHLLLLLGASGSGKSSVVRAGIMPRLLEKWGTHLVNLTFTPDEDPFESFYASLLSRYKQSDAKVVRQGKADALTQAVKVLKQPEESWLIFIDQFEELFTLTPAAKRDRWIESLVQLLRTQDSTVNLILTMRADFLDHFSAYPNFGRLTQKQIRLMTDMQRDEIWLAIKQPAARQGVAFEPGLIEEIWRDVQGQAGYLPLLQYTLDLLWDSERRNDDLRDRLLYAKTYRELGGVRGALQKRVDQLYAALPAAEQVAVKQIFLRLVSLSQGEEAGGMGKAVSRRAYRSEFSGALVNATLDELVNQNLLVSNETDRTHPTVEIAHEALLDSWHALKDWLADAHQVIGIKHRLAEDVARWQALQKTDAAKAAEELWSGSRLETALELRREQAFDRMLGGLNAEENRFLDTSLGRRDRQRRQTMMGLVGFSVGAFVLAGVAVWQAHQAEMQRRQALTGQIDSLSQSSTALFVSNREFESLLVALKSARQLQPMDWTDAETRDQVRLSLQQAIYGVSERNQLKGHRSPVNNVSFSPDGQTIASASDDGTIKLWNPNGQERQTLTGHQSYVWSVNFSPDGKAIASGSNDQTIKLWSLDGQLRQTLKGHRGSVNNVKFSPDGKFLASASDDGTVILWSVAGERLKTFKGHGEAVMSVSFSLDGKTIASAGRDQTIKLWTLNGRLLKTLKGHREVVNSVTFSADGKRLLSASADKTIKLWRLPEGRLLKTLVGHQSGVVNVKFSRDGQLIASASSDYTIKFWNLDGSEIRTLTGHQATVSSISFSPDGKTLASSSDDTTVKLWSLEGQDFRTFSGHRSAVESVRFSPDSQTIASGSWDNTIKLWNRDGQVLKTLVGHRDRVLDIAFSPDGKTLASTSTDRTIRLWNREGRLLRTLKGHRRPIYSVNFSPDGQTIASASEDQTIRLWAIDGRPLKILRGHSASVRSVRFSPDGQTLASASWDNTIKLWNREGQNLKTFTGHNSYVYSVRFSPDGKTLSSASFDGTVKLWNLEGQVLKSFLGHRGAVRSLSFNQEGTIIASASDDQTIRLWNLDGQELKTLKGHQGPVKSVAFSPDGTILASASDDNTIKLWNAETLDFEGLVAHGCNWVHDYLKYSANARASDRHLCDGISK